MGIRPPSSRAVTRIRFSPIDVGWALVAPLCALYLRNIYGISAQAAGRIALYCLVSLAISLAAFAAFRVHSSVPRCLSAHDLSDLTKAVAIGQLMTCIVLFTVTRLNGIPRSTPVIHGLLLWAGLVASRALLNMASGRRRPSGCRTV